MRAPPRLTPPPEGPRLLSGPQVQAKTSLSRCTIWRLVWRGEFPAPVQISPGRKAWSAAAVDAWIAERLAAGARDASTTDAG